MAKHIMTTQGPSLQIIVILFLITIVGLVAMRWLDKFFINTEYTALVRMIGITILLNILIFTFLVLSFSRIKTASGPRGPQGITGPRGNDGTPSSLAICKPIIPNAAELKFSIKNAEIRTPKSPIIIE